jgi:fermentation-respiration switch protein FrsA (DUF1100 family)
LQTLYEILIPKAVKMTASTRVEFLTVDGITLRGDLYMPNSATATATGVPIVVMTQGVSSSTSQSFFLVVAVLTFRS